ncbi:hypothetical protein ACQPYE_26015 [Actinosynnema sp. CA-299493]
MESLRFLLRDRDGQYGQAFDAVFHSDDLHVIKSAPQAPRMNARCERVIGTLRREALDTRRLHRTRILGGLVNECRHAADQQRRLFERHTPDQVRGLLVVPDTAIAKADDRLEALIAGSTPIDEVGRSITIFRRP